MNQPDPALGVFFHALGGLASASFYLPYRRVKGWSWESYWLVGGIFSWVIAPWAFALANTPSLMRVLAEAPAASLAWTYVFGVLWGIGGLTFGLTMRYLGIALGMAMALGYCAAFGTLMPPLFRGSSKTSRGPPPARSSWPVCSSAWPASWSADLPAVRRSGS